MKDIEEYLHLLLARDAGLIFLCVCGAILNGAMLYMLISKKQVRASVHTVYMVQIALTDLLVCLVWLVMTCIVTNNLLKNTTEPTDYVSNETEDDNASMIDQNNYATMPGEDAIDNQYRMWLVMHSWYNFHYYTNIFLLASMSVERCAAVWKSMRCQRYQYNRKVIYAVSVFMWLLALCFVIPNLVDPSIMVSESDSASSLSRTMAPEISAIRPRAWESQQDTLSIVFHGRSLDDNELGHALPSAKDDGIHFEVPGSYQDDPDNWSYDKEKKVFRDDLDILYECYTLMVRATNSNRDFVTDYGKITVQGCVSDIMDIMYEYSPTFAEEMNLGDDSGPKVEASYSSNYDYLPPDLTGLDYVNVLNVGDKLPDNANPPYDGSEPPLIMPHNDIGVYNTTSDQLEKLDQGLYKSLLTDAVQALIAHQRNTSFHEACDPQLSDMARIYVITVNLVLGFFVPFVIIVFSYVSIAYMIGKRAKSRLKPDMSAEASTTNFVAHYLQNPSTTNIPLAHLNAQMRDKSTRGLQADSMGRRMSDFMKYVLLRKPQDDVDRNCWTDSEREMTPYGSMQKMPLTSTSKQVEDDRIHGGKHGTRGESSRNGLISKIRCKFAKKENSHIHENDGVPDNHEAEESSHKSETVQLRNNSRDRDAKVNPRIKKYSFGYEVTNDNIPQTIAEHPREAEDDDTEEYLTASNGSFPADLTSSNARCHAALLLMQRNSRRESGGSYGSSMDSMATDQTSLMTSLGMGHDKRCSAATTMSALTPPTPNDNVNVNVNAFFPANEAVYNRSQSAEAGYPIASDNREFYHADQRSPRLQKPGSQLNDITYKLYRKSMQRMQHEEPELEAMQKQLENEIFVPETSSNSKESVSPPAKSPVHYEGAPRMTRSQSAPEDNSIVLRSIPRNSKSSSRIANEVKPRQGDRHNESQHPSRYPKYYRQNSASSSVYFTRGRTFSTTSNRSMGANTLRKTMARKNAERQWRVSRTVLAYVIVFALCWLPQRIVYLLYVSEVLMRASGPICVKLTSGARVLSFISVLLNPMVYVVTQRELRAQIRNNVCVRKLRHWYAKCIQKPMGRRQTEEGESVPRPPTSSNRRDERGDIEMQVAPEGDKEGEKEEICEIKMMNANRPQFWTPAAPRSVPHTRRNSGGPLDLFAAATALTARRRDATIDEMKEEEAAAEESLEKEMERIALMAEEERKREEDRRNENWFQNHGDDVISSKENSGSGNKTSSSGGKSDQSIGKGENFEEFWMRWLRSGGAELLSPSNGEITVSDPSNEKESSVNELGNIVSGQIASDLNNEIGETII